MKIVDSPRFVLALLATLIAGYVVLASEAAFAQSSLAMQKAPEEQAYFAASHTENPVERVAALEKFLENYPRSKHAERAREHRFSTLVEYLPDRAEEIRRAIKPQLGLYGKGIDYLRGEAAVAVELVEAGPHGVLLPEAEKIASDAEHHIDEAKWNRHEARSAIKFKTALPPPAELHKKFLLFFANLQLALADVYLHEDKLEQAKPLLDQAYFLQSGEIATNIVRGEYELATHDNVAALLDFERAAVAHDTSELFPDLAKKYRPTMLQLYRDLNDGRDSGLEDALDARYSELFPPPFTPVTPAPVQSGHVALLELFTGSGCPPCVGADYAVETLLRQYPRTDLVVLSFDQHQPLPDPLANPDSVARAALYHEVGTPRFVLDGTALDYAGGSREDSKNIYVAVEKIVTEGLATKSNVKVTLSANLTTKGQVQTRAKITTGTQEETTTLLNPPTSSELPKVDLVKSRPAHPYTEAFFDAPTPHLVLNFALVEDRVRYSGENGVRFHRMVVRSLASPADSGVPLAFAGSATAEALFDLSSISAKLHDYLVSYGHDNEQFFGPIEWRSTDTTLDPLNLVVVAWVQDTTTHRVLQSAIANVAGQSP